MSEARNHSQMRFDTDSFFETPFVPLIWCFFEEEDEDISPDGFFVDLVLTHTSRCVGGRRREEYTEQKKQEIREYLKENKNLSIQELGIKLYSSHIGDVLKRVDSFIKGMDEDKKNDSNLEYLASCRNDIHKKYKEGFKYRIEWRKRAKKYSCPTPLTPEFVRDQYDKGNFDMLSDKGKEDILYGLETIMLHKSSVEMVLKEIDTLRHEIKGICYRNTKRSGFQQRIRNKIDRVKNEEEKKQLIDEEFDKSHDWNFSCM